MLLTNEMWAQKSPNQNHYRHVKSRTLPNITTSRYINAGVNRVTVNTLSKWGMADQIHLVANTLKVYITRDFDVRST